MVYAPMCGNTSQSPTVSSGRLVCSWILSKPSQVGPKTVEGNVWTPGFSSPVFTPTGIRPAMLPCASAPAFVATGRTRDVITAWSYIMEFIMPYKPSVTKYWCESSPFASDPSSSLLIRLEKIWHARVTHASEKYRPGSEITLTPCSTGNSRSRESFTSPATAVRVTSLSLDAHDEVSAPENPPPMSRISIAGKPTRSAVSKATRANSRASLNAAGFVAPEPTWNAHPATFTPSAFAARSSGSTSAGSAPYLFPSTHRASGSSARSRSKTRMSGASAAIFASSPAESNVVRLTPELDTAARCLGSLHGLA
mmetsp:Transcript_6355/g.23966  ORF Transcript_6355/g.23966 Transcript_6355/m.23966 type:complete len:310 (+) Transcript_6355:475-1404(+)